MGNARVCSTHNGNVQISDSMSRLLSMAGELSWQAEGDTHLVSHCILIQHTMHLAGEMAVYMDSWKH